MRRAYGPFRYHFVMATGCVIWWRLARESRRAGHAQRMKLSAFFSTRAGIVRRISVSDFKYESLESRPSHRKPTVASGIQELRTMERGAEHRMQCPCDAPDVSCAI